MSSNGNRSEVNIVFALDIQCVELWCHDRSVRFLLYFGGPSARAFRVTHSPYNLKGGWKNRSRRVSNGDRDDDNIGRSKKPYTFTLKFLDANNEERRCAPNHSIMRDTYEHLAVTTVAQSEIVRGGGVNSCGDGDHVSP